MSSITPVYAGQDYLEDLVRRLDSVRSEWESENAPMRLVEAIFVDDASVDGSSAILDDLEHRYAWVRVVTLSRNFGQHRATVAGILHSSGDWLVTLDEDLQHDPRHIDAMLARACETSSDVVYAQSTQPAHGNSPRDFASRSAKWLIGAITANPHVKTFNSFRVIRGTIGRAAASVCSYGTYFDVGLCWFTNSIGVLRVPLKDIRYTELKASGYTVQKLLTHALRLITTSETRVLRTAAAVGLLALALSAVLGVIVLLMKILDPSSIAVRGWLSLFLTLLFFGGLITVMLGVLLEFTSLLVLRAQGKPTFFVVDRSSDELLKQFFESKKGQ